MVKSSNFIFLPLFHFQMVNLASLPLHSSYFFQSVELSFKFKTHSVNLSMNYIFFLYSTVSSIISYEEVLWQFNRDTLILRSLVGDTSPTFLDRWSGRAFSFTPQSAYTQSAWQFTSLSISHPHTTPKTSKPSFKKCCFSSSRLLSFSKPDASKAKGGRWSPRVEKWTIKISNHVYLSHSFISIFVHSYKANSLLLSKHVIIIYRCTNVAGVSKKYFTDRTV